MGVFPELILNLNQSDNHHKKDPVPVRNLFADYSDTLIH